MPAFQATAEIGDFNNDGVRDIAVAFATSNRIYLMLSDGARGFVITSTPVEPIENLIGRFPLAAADYNGDGNTDLALTVNGEAYFTVYFGNGAGGFASSMNVATGIGQVNSVTAVDYDDDGDTDVIASGRHNGAIVLFEGDGAGGVAVDETIPVTATTLYAVRAGDFNGDGAVDIQTGGADEKGASVLAFSHRSVARTVSRTLPRNLITPEARTPLRFAPPYAIS